MYRYFINNNEYNEIDFLNKLELEMQDDLMDQFNADLDKRKFEFEGVKYPYSDVWKLLDEETYWISFKNYRTKKLIKLVLELKKSSEVIEVNWNKYQVRRVKNVSN